MLHLLVLLSPLGLKPPSVAIDAASLCYRQAQPSDYQQISELRVGVFCPHLRSIGSRYLQSRVFCDALSTKTSVLVAAAPCRDGDSIVASADLLLVEPPSANADVSAVLSTFGAHEALLATCCYVSNVCVATSARGRGVGRSLMKHTEALAQELGAGQIVLHVEKKNVIAANLYLSMGFGEGQLHPVMENVFTSTPFVDPNAPVQSLLSKPVSMPVEAHADDAQLVHSRRP